MKLESQITMYLNFIAAGHPESTVEAYRSRLNRFKAYVQGRKVDKNLVRCWYTAMLNEGLSKHHVLICRAAVRALYTWLVENELAPENPVIKIKDCVPVRVERHVITLEEHERILVFADAHEDEDVWPYAVRCGWETGLRISDVAGLRWEHILWEERGLRMIPRKTKRLNKVVEIPLSDEFLSFMAKEHLKQGRPLTGFVSQNMASRYEASRFYHSCHFSTKIAPRVGVHKGFHSYRHGAVTRWLAQGVPLAMVSTMSGQTVDQIMEYCHITLAQKRKAMGLDPVPHPTHPTPHQICV